MTAARDHRPGQPRHAPRGHHRDETARHEAHADLMGHLGRLVRKGATVPCLGHRDTWTAPDDATQQAAAAACRTCPALTQCAAYVTAFPEPAGTWAGRTETQRNHPHERKDPMPQALSIQAQRDALALLRADQSAAVAMMAAMTGDEIQELAITFMAFVKYAVAVPTPLDLDDWCVKILRHLQWEENQD